MGQFQDVKWPAEYNELTRIEDLLHCRICYEYMETCVVTTCSHNYCSICIRKYLHYKTQCPICFENIYEKDLHANRILDEFMEAYLSLREKLFACIKGAELDRGGLNEANFTPGKSNSRAKMIKSCSNETPKKLPRVETGSTQNGAILRKESPSIDQLCKTPKKCIPSPSTSDKTPRMNLVFGNRSEGGFKTENNKKRVPCPVCSIEISETNINKHLDDCLKRQKSMSPPKESRNSLKPMPKYVMNLMKEGELRKVLKKYGLSTSGVRKTLEKRLQKFTTLYNVERDKLVPRSIEELVKHCEAEEITEKNILKQNSSDYILNVDRKADSSQIEKAHKQYLERNKEDYQKLIESINDREKGRSRSSRSLFSLKTGEDGEATTSSASQSFFNQSDEKNETNSSIADASLDFLHDTDSTNTSYPLQHYSRDDPMRFLALEISSDNQESPVKLEGSFTSRNQSPIEYKARTEDLAEAETSLDKMIPSNSSLEDKNSTSLVENGENNDIYDLSTEDNWSDSCGEESKAKKLVMKRTKVEDSRSSDSETDVETSFRFVPRKTAKKGKEKKKRKDTGSRVTAPNENGSAKYNESRDQEADNVFDGVIPGSSKVSKENKENSEVTKVEASAAVARRSSRKRNVVSYATGSKQNRAFEKGKKALDVRSLNLVDGNSQDEPKQENLINVTAECKDESNDGLLNETKRSLRKRRKF